MCEDYRENHTTVTRKSTFVVTKTELDEIQSQEDNIKDTHGIKHIPEQESDLFTYNSIQSDSIEIVDSFENEITIDPKEAVEKLNSETTREVLENQERTDNSVDKPKMKFWIFPVLFGSRKEKTSDSVEAPDDQTNKEAVKTLGPKSQAVGWFRLSRPGLREDADDRDYEEIASYGSFVNERPSGPMYNPQLHNYFIYYTFRLVLKMLLFTDIIFLVVNDFIIYPKWVQKYLKLDWPRRNFKKFGPFYMNLGLIVYIFVTYAFYCGPCTKQKEYARMAMIAGMFSVTAIAASYYVIKKFIDIVFSFYTTTVVAAMCVILARRQYRFTNPMLYAFCIAATLVPLLILYAFGTQYLKNIKFPDQKSKIKLALLCLYQSMAMIVQITMVTGHRAITYSRNEVYFAAFQLYSAFWQVFITIVEIMGLIEIECE